MMTTQSTSDAESHDGHHKGQLPTFNPPRPGEQSGQTQGQYTEDLKENDQRIEDETVVDRDQVHAHSLLGQTLVGDPGELRGGLRDPIPSHPASEWQEVMFGS